MWRAAAVCFLSSIASARAQPAPTSAGGFAPGAREIFSLNLAQEPLGEFPKSVRQLSGNMEVVEKDGQRMLRASTVSEFLITLPERLPERFTLEFDLITRASGYNSFEIGFEGTPTPNRSLASAYVSWWQGAMTIFGGRDASSDAISLPDDVRAEIEGQLAEIRVEFAGDSFKLYTNGRRIYGTPDLKFVRARVLRIALGGVDGKQYAVHLARLRIADASTTLAPGAPQQTTAASGSSVLTPTNGANSSATSGPGAVTAITGIMVNVNASGIATVTWTPLPVAATYFVVRWNANDPGCCNAMSPPGIPLASPVWQDGVLPLGGTYAYRIIGKTANGTVEGETRFTYQGAPRPPPGVASIIPTAPVMTVVPTTGTITPMPAPAATAPTTGGTATGVPNTGTILSPEPPPPPPAPYSSGPRTVTVMPTATATTPPSEATTTVEALPATTTGTIVPMAPSASTTGTSGGGGPGNLMAPSSNTSASSPARYRVMLTGFVVKKATIDDVLNIDGRGNEAYAAAAVVVWDRKLSQPKGYSFVQSQDYGDVGMSTPVPPRIQAGSISLKGGLTAGDRAPADYDPAGTNVPAAAPDRFPLLVWEGELAAGAEAVVVTPSIWERDMVHVHFEGYKSNWRSVSPATLMRSPSITAQYGLPALTWVKIPLDALTMAAPPAPAFTGQPSSGYKLVDLAIGPNNDRPIGMRANLGVLIYEERVAVITQEKVSSLKPGEGVTTPIDLIEAPGLFLGGEYTLYLRVQRL